MTTLKAGQVWKYHKGDKSDQSFVKILKVETYDHTDVVVHISVHQVSITTSRGQDLMTISHLPFAEKAVQESLTELIEEGEAPELPEGYFQWKSVFEQGKAGVWSISIAEAISSMEKAMSH